MIVVDTHALIWWASGASTQLSSRARSALTKAQSLDGGIVVSAITAWEIAALVRKGRLKLSMDVEDWLNQAEALPGVRFLPIDRDTAMQSVRLPEPFHQDPADRIIVATARSLNMPVVTADEEIRAYQHVKTIW